MLGLALASPAAARPDRGPGPLPWRFGHEVGFSVDATAYPESAATRLEVYVRIRPSLIADLSSDGKKPTPIQLSLGLQPLFGGGKAQTREQSFLVHPADTAGALGEVVVQSFMTRPGRHRLQLRLETRRRVLARRGMERPEVAKIEGEIVVPGPQAGREISDIAFLWSGDAAANTLETSPRGRVPNPERLYGLYANQLRARVLARAPEARPWEWIARGLDSAGVVLAEQTGHAEASTRLEAQVALDISNLGAGAYDLEFKAWQQGDAGALLRRARFSVAWREDSWKLDPQALADDVHFLLSADEDERFFTLTPGEQEKVLDEFWKSRDPTPDTGENEARNQYYRRVRFANLTYGRYGLGRGMFTDMGRTYIRYGEPDEVIRQVMPSLDDNLTRIIADLAKSEPRSLGAVGSREVGSDTRPFELWIYEGDIPLPIDAAPDAHAAFAAGKRLVFLFVDQHWTGDYRQLYSSE